MIDTLFHRVAGLDVHKMLIVGTLLWVLDNGEIRSETREFDTFRRGREALRDWLKEADVEQVVMESTGVYWKSTYETLEEAEIPVIVVNARHVKNVPGRKTDVKDSQWLADLSRCGLLRPSFIPSKDLRELRLIARYYRKVKGMRAGEINRLHKVLDDAGIRLGGVASDLQGVSAQDMIRGLIRGESPEHLASYARGQLKKKTEQIVYSLDEPLSQRHRYLLQVMQSQIDGLNLTLESLEIALFEGMAPYQVEWELIQTLPGFDRLSAALLLVEVGTDMTLFGKATHLASWAGLCPGNNESAGKRRSGRTRKGNGAVRTLLCEIANAARNTSSQFKGKYQSLVIRRGHKRSIIALAHKLLRTVFGVLRDKKPYLDPQIDYEQIVVSRNSPRWLKMLKQYGYLKENTVKVATAV